MYLFEYSNSNVTVNYKGNFLDSLLELKYVISVEDSHIWLRSDLSIHFKSPGDTMDTPWKQYTPDFLIRNIKTNRARLIEVKPDGYDDHYRLSRCRQICNDHISYFSYDWEFEVVFESDIHLTPEQRRRYLHAIEENDKPSGWHGHLLQNNICTSDDEYRSMVVNGLKPAPVPTMGHSLRRSV